MDKILKGIIVFQLLVIGLLGYNASVLGSGALPTGGYKINAGEVKNVYKNDSASLLCKRVTNTSSDVKFLPTKENGGWDTFLDNTKRPATLTMGECSIPYSHTFNPSLSSNYNWSNGNGGCAISGTSVTCGIMDKSMNIWGKTSVGNFTNISKVKAEFTTNPFNPDCWSKGGGVSFVDNNSSHSYNNMYRIYTFSSSSDGWGYDCQGNCPNKNYGGRFSNTWHCVNGPGLCNSGGKVIMITRQVNNLNQSTSYFNYVYVLNSDIANGIYHFKVEFTPGTTNNTELNIDIYNSSLVFIKNINVKNIPNPANGINFTQGWGSNYFPLMQVSKTCDWGGADSNSYFDRAFIQFDTTN